MTKTKGLLFTAGIVLATAFTLSCEEKNADKPSAGQTAAKDSAVTAETEPAAAPKTADTSPKADSRLIGEWWNGIEYSDGDCGLWRFREDGTGEYEPRCHYEGFDFSVVGNRINFRNGREWTDENDERQINRKWMMVEDDSVNVEDGYLDFSLSDNGKTLILGGKRYKKNDNWASCCVD